MKPSLILPSRLDPVVGAVALGRHRTLDIGLTYDNAPGTPGPNMGFDARGNALGPSLGGTYRVTDGFDENTNLPRFRTVDSTGAFLVGELDRLDPTMNMPLTSVSWARDIDLREDVTIADETTSYTVSTFGSPGGLGTGNGIGNGKAWVGKVTNQITGIGVDIARVVLPLTPWAMELKYTIFELESAIKLGRPIDQQKIVGIQTKHGMDVDEQVYYGDTNLRHYGLVNSDNRTGLDEVTNVTNVANGVSGSPLWTQKTAQEILADINELVVSVWTATAYSVVPNRILIPPAAYGAISTQTITVGGSVGPISILKYLMENNIVVQQGLGQLMILPSKWTVGAGVGGTIGVDGTHNRMVAYNKDKRFVRFPKTLLARTPLQYIGLHQICEYYCKIGVVEIVYPETFAYRDGL